MYDTILFDLDGTLTDPGLGITNSVAYALAKFGIPVEDRTSLYPFIGPPLKDSFHEFFSFSDEDCVRAIAWYREYFAEKGLLENEVYDGTVQMLTALKSAGKRLIVATSKPDEFSRRILTHFGLDGYFDFVAGATMDEKRTSKADVIAYAIEVGDIDPATAVMVGDRKHDILGAKANGLDSIGVLYGYGSREEMEEAGATTIAATTEEVVAWVMGRRVDS